MVCAGLVFAGCIKAVGYEDSSSDTETTATQCIGDKKILVHASELPPGSMHDRLMIMYGCGEDHYSLSMVDRQGKHTILGTMPLEEGARVWGRFVDDPSDTAGERAGSIVVVFGFEPAADDRVFKVEVFSVSPFRKVFRAWSYQTPTFEDTDGDGSVELIVYRDMFSIGRPDAQAWPFAFRIGVLVEPMDLATMSGLLARVRLGSADSMLRLQENCRVLAMDPCPLADGIRALRNQLAALDSMLGAK